MMLSLDNLSELLTALALLPSGNYTAKVAIDEDEENGEKCATLYITGANTSIRIVRWAGYDNT